MDRIQEKNKIAGINTGLWLVITAFCFSVAAVIAMEYRIEYKKEKDQLDAQAKKYEAGIKKLERQIKKSVYYFLYSEPDKTKYSLDDYIRFIKSEQKNKYEYYGYCTGYGPLYEFDPDQHPNISEKDEILDQNGIPVIIDFEIQGEVIIVKIYAAGANKKHENGNGDDIIRFIQYNKNNNERLWLY